MMLLFCRESNYAVLVLYDFGETSRWSPPPRIKSPSKNAERSVNVRRAAAVQTEVAQRCGPV